MATSRRSTGYDSAVRLATHHVLNHVDVVIAEAQQSAQHECPWVAGHDPHAIHKGAVGTVEVVHQPARLDPAQLGVITRHALLVDGHLVVRRAPESHDAQRWLERKTQPLAVGQPYR